MSDTAKIEQFITEFKKTWIYDRLSETLSDDALFEHSFNADGSIVWFKEQTRQMWEFWNSRTSVTNLFKSHPMDADCRNVKHRNGYQHPIDAKYRNVAHRNK